MPLLVGLVGTPHLFGSEVHLAPIVVVAPHPDDEVIGASTAVLNAPVGLAYVITLTPGDANIKAAKSDMAKRFR